MWLYLKFRFQRQSRRLRRDTKLWSIWLANYLDRHVWGKWRHLGIIRRRVLVWLAVFGIALTGLLQQISALDSAFLAPGPEAGGSFIEGVVGNVTTINPIFPESSASSDAARLVFNGLTRYTPQRGIEGDLATSWTISEDGKSYTFDLRRGVKWHDGSDFTAQDVLYTLAMIQHPDTRSPLASSWQGVKIEAKDDHTVIYTLPNPYPSFIYATTIGILPSNILGATDPAALRVAEFNQKPIGTGPFKLTRFVLADREIILGANPSYHGGKPLMDEFILKLFEDNNALHQAYAKRQLTAIGRLATDDIKQLGDVRRYELNTSDEVVLFWRTGSGLLQDKAVRQALGQAIDREAIARSALAGKASILSLPILPGQLGYNSKYRPPGYNSAQAEATLEGAGWKRPEPGKVRVKDQQPLKIKLTTAQVGDYPKVAQLIKEQLGRVGAEVEVVVTDVSSLQQSYIRPRNYDALLYGISIGADPDVYAYWHSSQVSDPGLNLSQYSSSAADKGLEGARLSSEAVVRIARYGNFLTAWSADQPAVVLYEPSYIYAVNPNVLGIKAKGLVSPSDRFYGIEHWSVLTRPVQRR